MPTYQKADAEVEGIAKAILERFESHSPLVKAKVKFDFIFAFPSLDENGHPKGDAIRKNGVKALGLCKIIGLKDRTMGRADVEILIDHPWWEDATDEQREALLDHELHHASVKLKNGVVQRDDLQRPLIKLRKHDVEIGWFDIIALRHGAASQERIQAKSLADDVGQLYWPDLCGKLDNDGAGKLLGRHGDLIKNHVSRFVDVIEKSGLECTISTPGFEPVVIGKKSKSA